MKKLKLEPSYTEKGILILVSGAINEDANFDTLKGLDQAEICLDLNDVTGINSFGIRNWIRWLGTFNQKSQIILKRCPTHIVDQFNMVYNFYPESAIVESFYVPYYNDNNGNEKYVLYRRGKEFNGHDLNHPADIKDDTTNEPMIMDAGVYFFEFLKKQPKI